MRDSIFKSLAFRNTYKCMRTNVCNLHIYVNTYVWVYVSLLVSGCVCMESQIKTLNAFFNTHWVCTILSPLHNCVLKFVWCNYTVNIICVEFCVYECVTQLCVVIYGHRCATVVLHAQLHTRVCMYCNLLSVVVTLTHAIWIHTIQPYTYTIITYSTLINKWFLLRIKITKYTYFCGLFLIFDFFLFVYVMNFVNK